MKYRFAFATLNTTNNLGASDMWTATNPFALVQFRAYTKRYETFADMRLAFSPNGHVLLSIS